MTTTDDTTKLGHLRALLADYAHPGRRQAGLLADIDALLRWALREAVPPGARSREVRARLGPPHGTVGEKSGQSFCWLYPSACSAAEMEQVSEWFYTLIFKKDRLHSIERRGWSD
jgi:hypothetical protein